MQHTLHFTFLSYGVQVQVVHQFHLKTQEKGGGEGEGGGGREGGMEGTCSATRPSLLDVRPQMSTVNK